MRVCSPTQLRNMLMRNIRRDQAITITYLPELPVVSWLRVHLITSLVRRCVVIPYHTQNAFHFREAKLSGEPAGSTSSSFILLCSCLTLPVTLFIQLSLALFTCQGIGYPPFCSSFGYRPLIHETAQLPSYSSGVVNFYDEFCTPLQRSA